jgi:type I restriction enzyme M protein
VTREKFPKLEYEDVPGLCKVASLKEIEAQGWSLNPGRYVGVAEEVAEDVDFRARLRELGTELKELGGEAKDLEEEITAHLSRLLE